MTRIYVAAPYTASTPDAVLDNVHAALDASLVLIDAGYTPYCPHLTHWIEKRALRTRGAGLPWDFYLAYDHEWLRHCEALVRLGRSRGADMEWEWAGELGIDRYEGLAAVPGITTAAGIPLRGPHQEPAE